MSDPVYVHLSKPMRSSVGTERGELSIKGFQALAGVQVSNPTFVSTNTQGSISQGNWARQQSRFWAALALGLQNGKGPWQTDFELRITGSGNQQNLSTSLWVKTFAPQDYIADQSAYESVEMIQALYPQGYDISPICSRTAFDHFRGSQKLQWFAEVRRVAEFVFETPHQDSGSSFDTQSVDGSEASKRTSSRKNLVLHDWKPTIEGICAVWELLNRLPDNVWVSITVCPTRLFPQERDILHETALQARRAEPVQGDGASVTTDQGWYSRLLRWSSQAFLLRLRIGGEPHASHWVSQALAAALMCPGEGSISGSHPSYTAVEIITPLSEQDWRTARFNWQWSDLLLWRDNIYPHPLYRLRYLADAVETGILAGVWR